MRSYRALAKTQERAKGLVFAGTEMKLRLTDWDSHVTRSSLGWDRGRNRGERNGLPPLGHKGLALLMQSSIVTETQ